MLFVHECFHSTAKFFGKDCMTWQLDSNVHSGVLALCNQFHQAQKVRESFYCSVETFACLETVACFRSSMN